MGNQFLKKFLLIFLISNLSSHAFAYTSQEVSDFESGRENGNHDYSNLSLDLEPLLDTQETILTNAQINPAFNEIFQNTAKWAAHVVYLSKDGLTKKVLTTYRYRQTIKPASTLKLFTGYLAFLNKNYDVIDLKEKSLYDYKEGETSPKNKSHTLSNMMAFSDNEMADEALISLAYEPVPSVTVENKQILINAGLLVMNSKYFEIFKNNTDFLLFRAVNGSGLNLTDIDTGLQLNQVTAQLETTLLETIYRSTNYNSYKKLLAEPSKKSTLEKRLVDINKVSPIYAKTGTLDRTIALAGFAETKNGVLIYSIIADEIKLSPKAIVGKPKDMEVALNNAKMVAVVEAQEKHRSYIDTFLTEHINYINSSGL